MDDEHRLQDPHGYLQRLAAGLHDKLRVERYLLPDATRVLDVGCADGALTLAMAARHPAVHFLGIDLDAAFVAQAQAHARQLAMPNVEFRCVYLRELLAEPARFDCVSLPPCFTSFGRMAKVFRRCSRHWPMRMSLWARAER